MRRFIIGLMIERDQMPDVDPGHRMLEICFEKARLLEQDLNDIYSEEQDLIECGDEVRELDQMFPFFMQGVYISGNGIFPKYSEDGDVVSDIVAEDINGTTGVHHGFMPVLVNFEGETKYRVMQKVLIGEGKSEGTITLEERKRIFHFYDLESRMLPALEMEAILSSHEFNDTDFAQRLQVVNKYSKDFAGMLCSTGFRRLDRKKQKRVVEDMLIEVEQQAGIRDLQYSAEPEYAFAPLIAGNSRHFIPLVTDNYLISGTCLGIDSLETAGLSVRAIRRDSDLAAKYTGLCVVIDPDNDTRKGLNLSENQVLYIPTLDQTFDAVVYTED